MSNDGRAGAGPERVQQDPLAQPPVAGGERRGVEALERGLDDREARDDHGGAAPRAGRPAWAAVAAACLRRTRRRAGGRPDEVGMRLIREPVHPKFVFSTHMLRHPHASSLLDSWRKYLIAVPTPS